MKTLFIDCSTGIAGDMLLAAFLDLGVPRQVIEEPLISIGLGKSFSLRIDEGQSFGIRGLRVFIEGLEQDSSPTRLQEITAMVEDFSWEASLRNKVLDVFKALGEAESSVHGIPLEKVHFHELGSIDALIEIVCVCAAVEYLNPISIFCSNPPAGSGIIDTSHGLLPVPVPVVLELAQRFQIQLAGGENYPNGELTTPTGLALMAVLADRFAQPTAIALEAYGIGLGKRSLDRSNFLRICLIDKNETSDLNNDNQILYWQTLVSQETWIDDATPEDISHLIDELRRAGAIEVVSQQVQMKKGRQGVCVKAIVKSDKANAVRQIWFLKGTTIGLREDLVGRWVLLRRKGTCTTPFGNVSCKQIRKPDGSLTIKPEHDELERISNDNGLSLEQVRREVTSFNESFVPNEEWSW